MTLLAINFNPMQLSVVDIAMSVGTFIQIAILPSSHLAPPHPVGQAQWPGRIQCPPFAHPLGKQMAGERYKNYIL